MNITQICTKCNVEKPIEQFGKSSNENAYKEHKVYQCKECLAEKAREWRKKNPNYRGSGALTKIPKEDRLLYSAIGTRLTDAKARTNKSGLPECDLDKDYLYALFKEQQGLCAIAKTVLKVEVGSLECLSLDKIIPDLGYVKGNVQWVAWAINRAKGELTMDQFVSMCQRVIEQNV